MSDPLSNAEIRRWLDDEWERVLESGNPNSDPEVDQFVNSGVVSIRYAFMTQILGKIADNGRNLMCLQKGGEEDGAWDARSFSHSVIVPWVADNHDVLGTSAEPYASKPLRRVRLTPDMSDVRDREGWGKLVSFLQPLDQATEEDLKQVFRRCLQSMARCLSQQAFKYQIPRRISLCGMDRLLGLFLSESSGGLRPRAASAALLKTLGKGFSLFSDVKSQGLNEADIASGMPGDIMCYDRDGNIALIVEVKDVNLALTHLHSSTRKANESETQISNLLFAVPGIHSAERDEINELIQKRWAAGLNVYWIDIRTLAKTAFVLLEEEWRVNFLRELGSELDARGEHQHRQAWNTLLSDFSEA